MAKEFENDKHRDKILDRIKKLLAVADGTKYEAEAETAMKMAQSYMSQYGLSLSDVELADELKGAIVYEELTEHADRLNPERWESTLAMAVGIIFDCKAIRKFSSSRSSRMSYCGYKADVDMAKLVFTTLYVSCRATACRLFPGGAGKTRLSFMYGVAETIYERAKEEKYQARKEPTGRYELVVTGKKNQVSNWIKENLNTSQSKARNMSLDPLAYGAGKVHGRSMDLMNRGKVSISGRLGYKG